jgi:membrane protein involved in colicin uptake
MAGSASITTFDIEEQRARIEHAHEETRKFVAEQHKLIAEQSKLAAERFKMTAETSRMAAEQAKLSAEAAKLGRDRSVAPWQVALSGMTDGAALFGAGAAFIKPLGA